MNDGDMEGRLSARATKRLFYNAEDDESVSQVFKALEGARVQTKQEIRPAEAPINPFAELEARNAELDRIRREMAMISDATQTLVKEPPKEAVKVDTVSFDALPIVVKQAAQAAFMKNFRHHKR